MVILLLLAAVAFGSWESWNSAQSAREAAIAANSKSSLAAQQANEIASVVNKIKTLIKADHTKGQKQTAAQVKLSNATLHYAEYLYYRDLQICAKVGCQPITLPNGKVLKG